MRHFAFVAALLMLTANHVHAQSVDSVTRADSIDNSLPSLAKATGWVNSPPLSNMALRGKVVLILFVEVDSLCTINWGNCLDRVKDVNYIDSLYRKKGVVVIGIDESDDTIPRSQAASFLKKMGVTYPVATDATHTLSIHENSQMRNGVVIFDKAGHLQYATGNNLPGGRVVLAGVIQTFLTERH